MYKATDHSQVFVRENAAAADAPEGQQSAHDLYQLLADHLRPMCAEHLILGFGSLKDVHVQLLLFLTEAHCSSTHVLK